jgi:hypothetical protein
MLVLPNTWRVSRILSLRLGLAVTKDVYAVLSVNTELTRAAELYYMCSGSHRPQFGPSTPTQQTGRPKIRAGCSIVRCQQPDVRKPHHATSLQYVHPLAKADHFMMRPS